MKKLLLTTLLASCVGLLGAKASDDSQDIVLKFRGLYNVSNSKQSNLPAQSSAFAATNPVQIGQLYSAGVGGEASVNIAINDHFSGELNSGITRYRAKASTIQSMLSAYNNSPYVTKGRDLYAVPSSLLLQYHIAPYGAVRPYLGAGGHYTYMLAKAKEYKVDSKAGAVFQAGVDIVFQDDTYINLDIKKYMLSTRIKYNNNVVDQSGKQLRTKMDLSPTSVGVGLGFKL